MNLSSAEQLKIAQDEQALPEALSVLWEKSRSVKVRKAIASNPNAGPKVLREAARLYLEEVLSNPGFSMLELFTEDPWIQKISKAYSSPTEFFVQYGAYHYVRGGNGDQVYWTCLLSPQLDAFALDRTVQQISVGGLRRAIKTPKTLNKLRNLYVSALNNFTSSWPFSLETLLRFFQEEIITSEDLLHGMSNYGAGSSSARRSFYTKYISNIYSKYKTSNDEKEQSFLVRLLAKTFAISRPHTIGWIHNLASSKDIKEWQGELYAKTLQQLLSWSFSKSLISDTMRYVGGVVAAYLRKAFLNETCTPEALEGTYNFVKKYGLADEPFHKYGLVLNAKLYGEALLSCSMEAKIFFTKAGCLGTWAGATSGDIRFIVFNDVNEFIYSQEGISKNLLFDSCSMRKIISIDQGTHVF
jgi:hypothetical protein